MRTLLGRLLCAAWCVCSRSAVVIDEAWRSFFIFFQRARSSASISAFFSPPLVSFWDRWMC
jgi:hypothetical protein